MDAEIPLEGASRQSVAASYRAVADEIARRLPALETEARALDEAARTYARLSEFRGVLERGGTPVVDPAPERDRLGAICRRGRDLVDELRRRAVDVESASARGPQPEGTP